MEYKPNPDDHIKDENGRSYIKPEKVSEVLREFTNGSEAGKYYEEINDRLYLKAEYGDSERGD